MTLNDLCPGLDQLAPRDQIIEVLTRLRSGVSLLECSRHLVPIDRETVGKVSDYADLLRDLIVTAGAGATQPNGEHAKPAPAPPINCGICPDLKDCRVPMNAICPKEEAVCASTKENANAT